MASNIDAFFLRAGPSEQRFCLFHRPRLGGSASARGAVLYIHPFAEEMNKSRRMAALQSRALAAAGYGVLQLDLRGCGDSSGEFGDARWTDWLDDVERGAQWLRENVAAPLWLWGLRAGCLVASAAAARMATTPCHHLFWQAPASGKTLLQQFMRLKLAGDLLGGKSAGVMDETRAALAAGQPVEIGGYMLGADLAQGLEEVRLRPPPAAGQAIWLELSSRAGAEMLPATRAAMNDWQAAGHRNQAAVVDGPAFWQTQEIEEAPALVQATLTALEQMQAAA